jgi:hypothetical protein
MGPEETYKQKEQKLKEYESISKQQKGNDTELAYRDMNTRFLNAEREQLETTDSKRLNAVMEAHKQQKLKIEAAWHKNTTEKMKDLKQRAPKKGSEKTAEYYAGYSMKELEVFLKNNDRGGNSDEYNAVATDLELLNRVMDSADAREGMGLLLRLKESCDNYLKSRSPFSSSGKIRKAIIAQVSIKVNAELDRQRDDYANTQKTTLAAMQEEASEEKVTTAFKAHHNLMYQVLNGNMTLTPEEMEKLDSDMEEVLDELGKQKVDADQSKTLSTKFFNALGWAGNEPRLAGNISSALKTSPHGRKLYHTINPLSIYNEDGKVVSREKDALVPTAQLAGIGGKRMYYGIGRIGKGCYTAAASDSSDQNDEAARQDSWKYGQNEGAVLMTMMLNEHARIISWMDMSKKKEDLQAKFPKVYKYLFKADPPTGSGFEDYLTMMAALYGYNTIVYNEKPGVDYLTTTDRKALTMDRDLFIRTKRDGDYDFGDLIDMKEAEDAKHGKKNGKKNEEE